MISYTAALQLLSQHIPQPLSAEVIPLLTANGRILASQLVAPHDMPPFAQSMMDGYAVRSRDTIGATAEQPRRLSLGATLTAGETLATALAPGQAVRIMTGAPLPRGADTVLRMEDSVVEGECLLLHQELRPGIAIQKQGAEVRRRTVFLRCGERFTPQRIGMALALGLAQAEVVRRPRLALVAPGNELLPPGAAWEPGKKWCSNLYALEVRAQELGCQVVNLGLVPDTLEALVAALQRGLQEDLVVILGASGRGDHDFAGRAMAAIGAAIVWRGVATNPGRSITLARHQSTLILGLPGSPWAAFIGFEIFAVPALRALLGQNPRLSATHPATVATPLTVRTGMTHFVPARLQSTPTGWHATPLATLLTLAQADGQPLGLIVVPPHRRRVLAGSNVRVQPLTL